MIPDQILGPRLVITGLPRSGKTTLIQRLATAFGGRVGGFYTQEVREVGARVGFEIVTFSGLRAWLSRAGWPGPKVGRYGVSMANLDRIALPAMIPRPGQTFMCIDEIGKMECLSGRFIAAMEELFQKPVPLVTTVALHGSGYIAAVKQRPEVEIFMLTPSNREQLFVEIMKRLSMINEA